MEASVKAVLQEAHEVDIGLQGQDTIAGLVVADSKGLCLQAQGVGRAQSAGLLTALATQAAALEPGRENPVLTITTKHHQYLVKKEDSVTVAIIKNTV